MSTKVVNIKNEALRRVFRLFGSTKKAEVLCGQPTSRLSVKTKREKEQKLILKPAYDDDCGFRIQKFKTENSKKVNLEKQSNDVKKEHRSNGTDYESRKRKRLSHDENNAPAKYQKMDRTESFTWNCSHNSCTSVLSQQNRQASYSSQLMELQHRIMTLKDDNELQLVVDEIAETGLYKITNETFDFDLTKLEKKTVNKLQIKLRKFGDSF
jgi:predicted Zn-ribbon and HTH transcriptional regulator